MVDKISSPRGSTYGAARIEQTTQIILSSAILGVVLP